MYKFQFFASIVTTEHALNTTTYGESEERAVVARDSLLLSALPEVTTPCASRSSISYIFLRATRMSTAYYYRKRHGTDRKPPYFVPPLRDVSTDFPIHESQLNCILSHVLSQDGLITLSTCFARTSRIRNMVGSLEIKSLIVQSFNEGIIVDVHLIVQV